MIEVRIAGIEPLDHGDLEVLARAGRCADCACVYFYPGPARGLARMIECAGCGSRYLVCVFEGKLLKGERFPKGSRAEPGWENAAVLVDPSHRVPGNMWQGMGTPTLCWQGGFPSPARKAKLTAR